MKDLVLLHGALGHPDQFNSLAESLKKEFNVHTLLFSGHGLQEKSEAFKVPDLVEQLNDLILNKGLNQPLVFGYSLGGYVALCHAIKYPNRISSILTLATKFKWSEEIAQQEIQYLNPSIIEEKVPKYAQQLATIHGTENWKDLLFHTAEMMVDIGRSLFLNEQSLSTIEIPVQVMVGDQDKMVSIEETQWAFKHLKERSMVVLPKTIHPFEKVELPLLQYLMLHYWKYFDE